MTKLEITIRPEKLDDLQDALSDAGYTGLTVLEARGAGRQAGYVERYRSVEYTVRLLPKLRVEVVAPDEKVEDLIEKFSAACKTGEVGDGNIFISKLDEAVRIRTGERGDDAI